MAEEKKIPVIESLEPASGKPGSKIAIKGKFLAPCSAVKFNGADAAFEIKDNIITATVPPDFEARIASVAVTNSLGTAISSAPFVVERPKLSKHAHLNPTPTK